VRLVRENPEPRQREAGAYPAEKRSLFGETILRLNLAEIQPPYHDNAPAISVADFLGVLFQGRFKAVDQDRPVERFGQEAHCASL
jgi:hypothetical protein